MYILKFSVILSVLAFVTSAYSAKISENSGSEKSQLNYVGSITSADNGVKHFDAKADAAILRKAVETSNVNVKSIIDVMTKRRISERMKIVKAYNTLYGKTFMDDLQFKLEGTVRYIINALIIPKSNYYAQELFAAFIFKSDDETIVEIMCTLNNCGILSTVNHYKKLYNQTLESVIEKKTSGNFRKLLIAISKAHRDENVDVNEKEVAEDAQYLNDFNKGSITDDSRFFSILADRSYEQLQKTFVKYKEISNHGIEAVIEQKLSDSFQKLVLGIVKSAKSKNAYLARRLYSSSDDHTILRIIISRYLNDIKCFKNVFSQINKMSLQDWIDEKSFDEDTKYALRSLIST